MTHRIHYIHGNKRPHARLSYSYPKSHLHRVYTGGIA